MVDTQIDSVRETDGELHAAIDAAELVVVAGHTDPDGDAIGSCLAFAAYLEKIGKHCAVLLENYDHKYNIIPGGQYVYHGDYETLSPDLFIALDASTFDRLGRAKEVMSRSKRIAMFDHHINNSIKADIRFTDKNACSTTVMVYRYINQRIFIDAQMATAIYAGLVYDTGGFRHNSTTPETLEVAANLMRVGADFSRVYNKILFEKSREQSRLFVEAISNTVYVEPDIAYTITTLARLSEHGGIHPEGVVDYLMNIQGVNTAVHAVQRHSNVKVSIRSRTLNVGEIAGKLGGGGHKAAAGFTAQGAPDGVVSQVLKILTE